MEAKNGISSRNVAGMLYLFLQPYRINGNFTVCGNLYLLFWDTLAITALFLIFIALKRISWYRVTVLNFSIGYKL